MALDNDLRRFRDHDVPMSICLSSVQDLDRLPFPWHREFWTKPMSEDEVGMPLISLGEKRSSGASRLTTPSSPGSKVASRLSSFRNSRNLSRRPSHRNSFRRSRSASRRSSLKVDKEEGEDWEWVWEDEEEEKANDLSVSHLSVTTEKLEEVKEIIEKPEASWRVLRQDSPVNSVTSGHQIQAGLDSNDVLSMFKVGSAKQWKAMSKNLVVNINDVPEEALEEDVRPQTPSHFKPTKAQQLRLLCWKIKPWEEAKDKNLFTSVLAAGWGVDCDEVYPKIFIGDEASARNIPFLHKVGITHVLNTAEGIWTDHSFVDLTSEFYDGSGITYQGLQLWDHPNVKILPYLGCANEFIAGALKSGGKCLVHCQMGVSRSATCAIAYMMMTQGWLAVDTFRLFRKRRDIRPNDYYLDQLVELDNDLRKERELGLPRQIHLVGLSHIDALPKPWHVEFWKAIPTDETLPFTLSSLSHDAKKKRSSALLSNRHSQMSEWEWEYYSQSEEEENRSLYEYGAD